MRYPKNQFLSSDWFKRFIYAIVGFAMLGLLIGISLGAAFFVATN
jgi:hypothetical protein